MKLLSSTSVRELFPTNDEMTLLRCGYARYSDLNDPLRCCLFALIMRELIRIAMERLAPDKAVRATGWFVGSRNGDKVTVTRAERYRFAISGWIGDEAMESFPLLSVHKEVRTLRAIQNQLNKSAHFSPGTFHLSDEQATEMLERIESSVLAYAERVVGLQDDIGETLFDIVHSLVRAEVENYLEQFTQGRHLEFSEYSLEGHEIAGIDLRSNEMTIEYEGPIWLNFYEQKTGKQFVREGVVVVLLNIELRDFSVTDTQIELHQL